MRNTHPLADPDGLLRDGPSRELFYQHKVQGTSLEVLALRLYECYNPLYFQGRLPPVALEVTDSIDVAGCFHWEEGPARIQLHTNSFDSYEGFRDTLLHEMCHVARRLLDLDRGLAHSAGWVRLAERVGVYVSPEDYAEAGRDLLLRLLGIPRVHLEISDSVQINLGG